MPAVEERSGFLAPDCPKWGDKLVGLEEKFYTTHEFNSGKGVYEEDIHFKFRDFGYFCPFCGADVSEILPEGIVRYRDD